MAIQDLQEASEASLCVGHVGVPAAWMRDKVKTQRSLVTSFMIMYINSSHFAIGKYECVYM